MPSATFAALALQASAAADAILAEAWTLTPMMLAKERAAAAVPDPSRAVAVVQGTFVDPRAKPDLPNSYDRRETRRPGEVSGRPRVLLSPAAQAAVPGLEIRQGDLLKRLADGVTWRVGSTFPMAGGSLDLGVNIVG